MLVEHIPDVHKHLETCGSDSAKRLELQIWISSLNWVINGTRVYSPRIECNRIEWKRGEFWHVLTLGRGGGPRRVSN